MKSTIITIIGTTAIGLLKRKMGSSVKVVKENKYFFIMPTMYIRYYADNLDYLGLDIKQMYVENISYPIERIKKHRAFLIPIDNSPVIKSVGLYISEIEITDEDEDLGDLYSVYCKYIFETYDSDLVLDEQNLEHITNISSDILSALQQVIFKVSGGEVVYNEEADEIFSDDLESFMTHIGESFTADIHNLERISEYFIIEKNGTKRNLRENIRSGRSEKPSKLRKR